MHLQAWRGWGVAAGAAVVAAGLTATTPARGQAGGDHAAAEALVLQLEHDPAHAAVTADALASARNALERATRLRAAGDETHARAADGLALECAQTARDVARAADAEAKAAELRHKAVDAQAQLERTRAQVEEGIAHVGRLRAQLDEADQAGKVDRVAVEVHEGDRRKKAGAKKSATLEGHKATKATGDAP
jgi:colicin import membrane protein